MKPFLSIAALAAGLFAFIPASSAATCANGVYRAGCVGPNGAAAVRKPPPAAHPPATVNCAKGVYRAGCAGPNGAVVRRY